MQCMNESGEIVALHSYSVDDPDSQVVYVAKVIKAAGRKKLEVHYMDAEKDDDDVQDFAGKWSMCTGDEGEPCVVGVDTVFDKVNLVNTVLTRR